MNLLLVIIVNYNCSIVLLLVSTMDKSNSLKKMLFALGLPVILSSLNSSIANVALPLISEAFSASFAETRWVIISYLISMTGAAILSGSLGDRFNRKSVLIYSISLFTLFSIACALSPSINWLIAFRACQGMAAAAMISNSMALFASTKSSSGGGVAMGWIGTLSAIGTAGGPSIGGLLLDAYGWQSIFYLNVPFSLISILLITKFIEPQEVNNTLKEIDIAGISVLTFSILLYSLGMTSLSINSILYVSLGFVGGYVFYLIERKVKSPAISIELLKLPSLYLGAILSLIVSTVMMTTLIVGPFYLIHVLSLPLFTVGFIMAFGPFIAACFGVPAGKMVDRFGSHNVVMIALTLMLIGFMLFGLNGYSLTPTSYMILIALITIGYAIFQTANNTGVMFGIDSKQKGILSGVLNLSRNIGLINGATLMGTIFSFVSKGAHGDDLSVEHIANGFIAVYLTASGLVFIAVILAFWLRKQVKEIK